MTKNSRGSGDFSIGSRVWPGLSKLVEECGEVAQVIGKLMGTGGQEQHWDGTNLKQRLEEEIADSIAAQLFVIEHCGLDFDAIEKRSEAKYLQFTEWHKAGDPPPAQETE